MGVKTIETTLIGKRIRLAMLMKYWTQEELAVKIGVGYYQVSRWISGQYLPDVLEFKKIADATGQPMEFFFRED